MYSYLKNHFFRKPACSVKTLDQRFSICGLWTCIIDTTWGLAAKCKFSGSPQTYWIRNSGVRAQQSVLTSPPGDSDVYWHLRSTCQDSLAALWSSPSWHSWPLHSHVCVIISWMSVSSTILRAGTVSSFSPLFSQHQAVLSTQQVFNQHFSIN